MSSVGQVEFLEQWDQINATGFEHRAIGQIDLVQAGQMQPLLNGAAWAGQEAGANPMGDRAQPQIKARGLDLIAIERPLGRFDAPGINASAANGLFGQ
jgi:hypothetical protein